MAFDLLAALKGPLLQIRGKKTRVLTFDIEEDLLAGALADGVDALAGERPGELAVDLLEDEALVRDDYTGLLLQRFVLQKRDEPG